MKLPFFHKPNRYVPTQQRDSSLQGIREKIITIMLASALTLGAVALVVSVISAQETQQYPLLAVYAILYLWVVIVTLQRHRFSYIIKAYSLALLFYILGIINLLTSGLTADAGVFLLSFTLICTIMISTPSGIFALVLSIGAFALTGIFMSTGSLVPPLLTNYQKAMDWVSGGVILVLLSTILASSINTILRSLNDNINKVRILAVEADSEREQLRRRSQEMQRRLAQLRAAAEIEHTISAVLDPKELMQKVVDLLSDRFGLYHVGVFLLGEKVLPAKSPVGDDDNNQNQAITDALAQASAEVVLSAGSGNAVPKGYTLTLSGASNAWWTMVNRKPRVIETTGKKDAFTATYLPLAHTELASPLISHERVIGVLIIHSTQSNAFEEDDISLFQSAADSLAIALENARLFKQNQDDLEEIRALQRQYLSRAWAETHQAHGNLSYTYEADQTEGEQLPARTPSFSAYSTPINIRNLTIGHFELESEKNVWSNEDRAFIESVITEAAMALENTRLLDETQRRANHDRLIAEVTRVVQSSSDIESILTSAIRELGHKLQASEALISLEKVSAKDEQEVTS